MFEVAIIGAGVAGVALAVGLQEDTLVKKWCHITIYEAAPQPRDREGHAVVCGSEYQLAIKMIGTKSPKDISDDSPAWQALLRANPAFHTWEAPLWLLREGKPYGKPPVKRDPPENMLLGVRRGAFAAEMRHTWEERGGEVKWGKALDHIEVGDRYTLRFQDGSTTIADTVIGADGVNSAVRTTVMTALGAPDKAIPTGGVMFRKMIPKNSAYRIFGEEYAKVVCQWPQIAQGVFFLSDYLDGGDTFQIIVDFPSGGWPQGAKGKIQWDKQAARKQLEGYGWIGRKYAEAFGLYENDDKMVDFNENEQDAEADPENTLWAWTRKTHSGPPPTFCHPSEAIVVMGDAAQTFQPYSGAGASEAVTDGMVISNLVRMVLADMSSPSDKNLRKAFHAAYKGFDAVRRPGKTRIAALGNDRARTFTGDSPMGVDPEKWKPVMDDWGSGFPKTKQAAEEEYKRSVDRWCNELDEGKRVADEYKRGAT